MNSTTGSTDLISDSVLPIRLRYYTLLFAGILWGVVFGFSALKVYAGISLIKVGSMLALGTAAFFTVWVATSRVKRSLTVTEVVRLAALCFLVHWAQDVLLELPRFRGQVSVLVL